MKEFDDLLGGLDWFDLDGFVPQEEALALVPARLARAFNLIPIYFAGRTLSIAVSEFDTNTGDMIFQWLGDQVETFEYRRGERGEIEAAIEKFYPVGE
ncbi:MAG: GspE/PulE/PilB domain-containing protein [Verrucomicrobiia bacterium]|jgi:hypothetical protein